MGRKTQARSNYRGDAIVMRRTIDAIAADTAADDEWRRKVTYHLHEAMTLLLQRDAIVVDARQLAMLLDPSKEHT